MSNAPKYLVARFILVVVTAGGMLAIFAGLTFLPSAQDGNLVGLGIGIGLCINGLLAIAGAQIGSAALDTAVSTRRTADLTASLLAQQTKALESAPQEASVSTGLRAAR